MPKKSLEDRMKEIQKEQEREAMKIYNYLNKKDIYTLKSFKELYKNEQDSIEFANIVREGLIDNCNDIPDNATYKNLIDKLDVILKHYLDYTQEVSQYNTDSNQV